MSVVQCLESDVSRVLNSIDTVCCDCDGVLYLSQTPIPGANEAIRRLEQHGKKVLFVTNNGAISRLSAMAKLNRLGFDARLDQIFTPSFVVAQYLQSKQFEGRVSCPIISRFMCSPSHFWV
jgi:HAD superfamily hydrolase (TIGR01450 family)